jgi:hypothetical protein
MRGLSAASCAFLLAVATLAVACGTTGSVGDSDDGNGECPGFVANAGDVIPEPPDGVSLCPEGACNYQSQEGCGANQACRPSVTETNEIVPACSAAGMGVSGDTCKNWTDCAAGYVCPDGQCRKLCCGRDWSESACDEGEGCFRDWSLLLGDDAEPTGAYLCFPTGCDLFTSEDCPADRDCKLIDPRGTTACVPPTAGEVGDRCSPPAVCGRGLSCVGQPGEETCRRLCRAEECGEPSCGPGEGTCVHFNRDPPGVGECTPGWPAP